MSTSKVHAAASGRRRAARGGAIAVAVAAILAVGPVERGATARPAQGSLAATDAVPPPPDPSGAAPAPPPAPASGESANSSMVARFGSNVSGGVSLTVSNGATVTLAPTDRSASASRDASVARGGLVDRGGFSNTAVGLRFSPAGMEAVVDFRSVVAPHAYRWVVGDSDVKRLLARRDGSVAIEGASGPLLRALRPSAIDAAGRALPVSVSVSGHALSIALGATRAVTYPVVLEERFVDQSRRTVATAAADNPWCIGPVSRPGMNIFDIDTTRLHHIRWGAQWSPGATYGVKRLTAIGYQYINGKATDQTYSKLKPVYPQYTFHSGIAHYRIVGGGRRIYQVHRRDYYQLFFQSWGNGFYGYATRGCWVG